ncbi:MAG: citramalate synthase [Deltaproteobacteria bacterium RBG_13_53_10]|nr:MAG: citramalate synthase [Deltaproteobacteria bacterium RBG_13_53_10]
MKSPPKVKIYDTTLRDGSQAEDIAFSVEDKVRIAHRLDQLGIHYIEGGWPGSNPKDLQFFEEIRRTALLQAKIAAFGSTCRAGVPPEKDENLKRLIEAGTKVVTLFGKSWDIHPLEALNITLEQNLEIIFQSIRFLKDRIPEVIFDAEHFFDGFKSNPQYALSTLKAAQEAKADWIVLCDTNGGTFPDEVQAIVERAEEEVFLPLGIHAHNDSEMAVANTISAVKKGATLVQGTINGYGERCGNANLCSIIPNLKLKMGIDCITDEQLKEIRNVSRFVSELANLPHYKYLPYVGDSAFAHKAGVHVSAIRKKALTYEHVLPEQVGNHQRVLISDLSGESNILHKAAEYRIDIKSRDPKVRAILDQLKRLENQGFQFEGAEGSFEILIKKGMGRHKKFFDLIGFRVVVEKRSEEESPLSEATIMVRVGDQVEHTAAMGDGPVNALDNAIRKALEKFYPELKEVKLLDYKVRILSARTGTAAQTRVLVESGDGVQTWGTVGVSENIIEASWQALVDSIDYKLLKEEEGAPPDKEMS